MKNLIFAFIIFCFSQTALANQKPKILVTIPPIASLVKMVVGNLADVEIIQKSSSCPHHFHLKPSEVFALKNADFIVLINEKFESNIAKYTTNIPAQKIIISQFQNLRIEDSNFHIWLDQNNAKIILDNIKNKMIQEGLSQQILQKNYLAALETIKITTIPKISPDTLILGDSLYYLTESPDHNFFKLSSNPSFKKLEELKLYIEKNNIYCIIKDPEFTNKALKNFYSGRFVEIDAENWDISETNLENLYQHYIERIYKKLSHCSEL